MKSRPELHEVPLPEIGGKAKGYITIDEGAWDSLIEAAYKMGWFVIEIKDEKAVRAFKMQPLQ